VPVTVLKLLIAAGAVKSDPGTVKETILAGRSMSCPRHRVELRRQVRKRKQGTMRRDIGGPPSFLIPGIKSDSKHTPLLHFLRIPHPMKNLACHLLGRQGTGVWISSKRYSAPPGPAVIPLANRSQLEKW
jgi:hypothetical protein